MDTSATTLDTSAIPNNTLASGSALVNQNPQRSYTNAILVRRNQKGNPLMEHLRNVPWQYGDILADYEVGRTTGVLFLSLKYHRLHPEYCYGRIQALEKRYLLRVLLILCDVGDQHEQPIRELTKSCLINEVTIVVAWSYEEAALYVQTYKTYENRPPDSIKERLDKDYNSVLRSALTSIKGVNKTDVATLRTHFGSFAGVVHASPAQLSNCPGIGPTKVRRLNEALNQPFRRSGFGSQGKGSEPAASTAAARLRPPAAPRRPITEDDTMAVAAGRRSPSPDWDIELDLNESADRRPAALPPWQQTSNISVPAGTPRGKTPEPRQYSPDWNIDMDSEGNIQTPPPSPPAEAPAQDPVARKKRRLNMFTS